MSKFEAGDKVSVEGEIGYVRETHSEVQVDFGDRVATYDEEWVVNEGEDKYEYATKRISKSTGEPFKETLIWMTKDEAQSDLKLLGGSSQFYNYKMVKRRKAGKEEDV